MGIYMVGVGRNVAWILGLLAEKKLVGVEKLEQAQKHAEERGLSPIELLPELGYISEDEIAKLLSSELDKTPRQTGIYKYTCYNKRLVFSVFPDIFRFFLELCCNIIFFYNEPI